MKKNITFFILFLAISAFSQTTKEPIKKDNLNAVVKTENVKKDDSQEDKKDISTNKKNQINKVASAIQVSTSASTAKNVNKEVEEEEYSEVMTDVMETGNYDSSDYGYEENQSKATANSIPYYYGKVKGTLSENGKNFLVLENDDGTIYLLQIYQGKDGVYFWKLSGKFDRN